MSSSSGSRDSFSDHRQSRTTEDSAVQSVDCFLNESPDSRRGRRSRSSSTSASSVVRSLADAAELQHRELLCRTGAVGPSATTRPVTTMYLRDEDSNAAFSDEDDVPLIRRKTALARAGPSGGAASMIPGRLDDVPVQPRGPAPGVADYLRPSSSTEESIELSLSFCDAPANLVTMVPSASDRPWTAPPGYLCVYEKHITDCGLTFPIPAFLLQYASRRQMAFAQLSPAAIRNAYGLIRSSGESSLTPKLVVGAKSKTNDWLRWYFFVKVNNESAGDVVVTNYHGWTVSPVRCPKIFDPYPEKLRDDVKKILAVCPYTWPGEEDHVRRPSSKPKGKSRRGGSSKTRKTNKNPASLKIMGKLNVDAVGDYSSRYKKKSATTPAKTSREEDEAMALGKRLSLAEYEAKERERRPSGRQDRREEGDRRDRRDHGVGGADRSDVRSDVERERREKEVAEARSAKLPVVETSHDASLGGREVILYDNSQVEPTRKRAADESETVRSDPTKKQRTAWAPDYRWRYDYDERNVHISTDSTSCAELFRKIHVGPSPFFELQDMWERTAFTDAAKKSVAAVTAIDRMAYMYERRLRVVSEQNTASKDHQRALAAETKRADQASRGLESANSEVQLLREEVAKLKEERDNALSERERCLEELSKSRVDFKHLAEQSQAEEARLRERRTEYEHIQRYFTTRDAAYPKFLDYNQAVGIVDLLKALAETGEVVLNSKDVIERLEADAEELKKEVNAFDIAELEEGWNDVGNLFKGSLVVEEFAPSVEGVNDEVAGDVEAVDQVIGDGDTHVGDRPLDEPAS
ncbi:meiosis-specific protein ASY2-like [Arabidopsis lyrata subsp. lyrata]|uniref:meiosis-specific protein ASY2-like n=1 Tax=Arabidopsis lyrata subsp. lyrata TaxID=81972 RepID=UPI000A29E730|nr:meiosis-specific protein ASY2-like [Arabidopsis lyrata subsp. lyrata]|eukprot:XP_020887271.1 meiosis-specific protein ASY2-like [Arabidopsis lyrata subsp. lyrata]